MSHFWLPSQPNPRREEEAIKPGDSRQRKGKTMLLASSTSTSFPQFDPAPGTLTGIFVSTGSLTSTYLGIGSGTARLLLMDDSGWFGFGASFFNGYFNN